MPMLPNNTPRFTFTVGGLHFSVRRFKGDESISKLFEFELELVSKKSDIAFDSVINQMGRLTLQQFDDVEPRYVHGIVNYFEQRNKDGKYTNYYAQLVPLFWLFTQRQNCRIFQKLDVQKIIDDIFKKAGMPSDFYRFDLELTHPEREYCVQYRETEWNFITRLMEEEGIFCYFEHTESKAILVMQDHSYVHPPIPSPETVIFHEISGYAADEEHLFFFNYAESIRSGKATLRDFNLKKPTMDMERDKEADKTPELEVYDYPGLYDDPGVGKSLASVRLEAFQTPRKQGSGESTSMRFIPGYRFTLDQHPRDDFNKSYLITSLIQEGKQPQVLQEQAGNDGTEYTSELKCIPAEVSYRPQRVTRKPVVDGPQTAIVVGPGGEEIYVDQHGRVKVQFHWDREGQMNEKSSCWIRVSQLWAGQKWGAMYIPRIGQEVIVDFLEGDPDRPIITGRVYHGDNLPPYPLPQNKTKSTIKSNSSKGGGGFNEFRFEDQKGQEEVYLQAEKDWDTLVKNDKTQLIQHDETLTVDNDRTRTVHHDEKVTIDHDRTKTVSHDESLTVVNDRTRSVQHDEKITIDNNRTKTVKNNETTTVTANRTETVEKGDETVTIEKGNRSISVQTGKNTLTVMGSIKTLSKSSNIDTEAKGDYISLKCGASSIILYNNGHIAIEGVVISLNGSQRVATHGGEVYSTADGTHMTQGATVSSDGMAVNTVKGGAVLLNP